MGEQEGTANCHSNTHILDLTPFLDHGGHTETFDASPASQGTDHVTRQVGEASAVSGKPPSSSAATSICCRPFIATAQNVAEGEVKPGAGQYTIRPVNTRKQ